jgi:hypothetical protein
MWNRATSAVVACVVVGAIGGISLPLSATSPQNVQGQGSVIAHEWGTFTTVAGPDGQAQEWLPLGGPTDLPCFVETYENRLVKILLPGPVSALGPLLNYETARSGLKGTVRMETPVVYFYAHQPVDVSVRAGFPRGLFTEWYPTATVAQLPSWANVLKALPDAAATISWPHVSIRPGTRPAFPDTDRPSHYYAARETDAAPIQVNGQDEKFLFYRGVGGFGVPIAARPIDSRTLGVHNLGPEIIPAMVVFTNRGGRIGYRIHRNVDGQVTVAMPPLNGTLAALRRDLATLLIAEGLYPKEADAMINTWRDTWFEEGTRVLYIVPKPTVDAMLPLSITPAPQATARVFVGRMDVITAEHIADVRRAIARNDRAALARHGRLLGVIGERILETTPAANEKARIEALLKTTFQAYVEVVTRCD